MFDVIRGIWKYKETLRGASFKKLQIKRKPSLEEIRKTAYLDWEKAGKPCGKDVYFWLEAERKLNG